MTANGKDALSPNASPTCPSSTAAFSNAPRTPSTVAKALAKKQKIATPKNVLLGPKRAILIIIRPYRTCGQEGAKHDKKLQHFSFSR